MKPSWLDVVSVSLLSTGLAAGVWQHLPVAAPWAVAFAVYVVARVARDSFQTWREERALNRMENKIEVAQLSKMIAEVEKSAEDIKAMRDELAARYASLEADVRAIQGSTNMAQGFGIPGLNFGPSFGPTRGNGG